MGDKPADHQVDYLSLVHAVFALTAGSVVAAVDIILAKSAAHWLRSGSTSTEQTVLIAISAAYYVIDLFRLIKPPRTVLRNGLCLHHIVCLLGIVPVALYGLDGPVLLVGMLIGELSNPPRLLAMRYEFCRRINLIVFVACRIACAIFLEAAFPHIQLLTTKISALSLLILSVIAIFYSMHIQPTVIVGARQRRDSESWSRQ